LTIRIEEVANTTYHVEFDHLEEDRFINDTMLVAAQYIYKNLNPMLLAEFQCVSDFHKDTCEETIGEIISKYKDNDNTRETRKEKQGRLYFGEFLDKRGYYDKAKEKYKTAIAYDPKNSFAYNNLGIAFYHEKNYREARENFEEARNLKPDNPQAYNNIGLILIQEKKYDCAIEEFVKAIDFNSSNFPEAYNNWGWALFEKGHYSEARLKFEKATELRPDYDDAYSNLGDTLIKLGENDEAFRMYEKAIQLDPKDVDNYNSYGNALMDVGHYDEGIDILLKAVDIQPKFQKAYFTLGEVLEKQNKIIFAIVMFNKVIKLDPTTKLGKIAKTKLAELKQK
jgi:tetratricopeptide (TPR) repeat protein